MAQATALKQALELYHMPTRVRAARAEALPDGVLQVLLVAAGDEEALREATEAHERPVAVIRDAAAFYIEQILLGPGHDSYRVLGSDADAPVTELRRNMALLLRFLHPDLDPDGKRSMFAGKVISAWDDLKSPERRSAYDGRLAKRAELKRSAKNGKALGSGRPGNAGGAYSGAAGMSRSHALAVIPPEREGLLARAMKLLLGRKL